MEFCLLGPLVVRRDGAVLTVPVGKQRVLLAALLVNQGRMVPVDELAELLWASGPPPSARVAVQNYVKRLRQALGETGRTRISTGRGGYRIDVGVAELDVSRFADRVTTAQAAARAGRWDHAAAGSAAALELWRGEPLEDVDSEPLKLRVAPRLAEMRLQAVEARIGAELHLGRHAEVIPELYDLTRAEPLREHLHALLMLALYRCGRQADALAAYKAARSILIEEVGTEPGPGLRDLHKKILAADPALATTGPGLRDRLRTQAGKLATALGPDNEPDVPAVLIDPVPESTPIAPVPRQLPAAARHFTARRKELEQIIYLLQPSQSADVPGGPVVISAIDGMGGIGKTALAVHTAYTVAGKFPDGQLFIDLHGWTPDQPPREPGQALEWLLRALEVPAARIPVDVEARAALFRQRLAGTRTLILLDNALDEAQVRPLLPAEPGCLVLITSRRRLRGLDDARSLSLDLLPEADAVALLRAVAGPDRVAVHDPLLAEIADLCGRLPLALRIAGALLHHRPAWSLEYLAGLLRDRHRRIAVLRDGERDVATVFDLSYTALDERHQLLLRRLSLVPGPDSDAYAAAALLECDPDTAAGLLEDLVDDNLLITHTAGRYRMHDLIRDHTRALTNQDTVEEAETAMHRLLDYYQHTADRADALVNRYPRAQPADTQPGYAPALLDTDHAWSWLRVERPNLLAAIEHSTAHRRDAHVVALTNALAALLRADGPWSQALALYTAALAAGRRLHDRAAEARTVLYLGDIRGLTGDLPGAERDGQEALDLYRALADRQGQAAAFAHLGLIQTWTGEYTDAACMLQKALEIYRDMEIHAGQALALLHLGETKGRAADFSGAARDYQDSLELYRLLDDRQGQAMALIGRGEMRRLTGDYTDAIRDQREALRIFQGLGHQRGQAGAHMNLAAARLEIREHSGAASDLSEALRLYRRLGDQQGQANVLTLLGTARKQSGDYHGSTAAIEEALTLFRRIGARGNETYALNQYAAVIAATGDHTRAVAHHHEALHLARQLHQSDEEAIALEGIGECCLSTGEVETGTTNLNQALEIYDHLGMATDAHRVRSRLRQLAPLR